jgi:tetratricopeptide (TPR) repeat protein
MRAAVVLEDGEALAARRAALLSERERLLREQPEGWEDAERAAADEARALESQARVLEEQARVLGATAFDALRGLQAETGDAPDVLRGVAAFHALGGDHARAETAIRTARDRAASDPWLDLVEGWVNAGAADPSVRERALAQLETIATAHPGLLRGRYLLARTQASLGRRTDALATLERLLADNPRHAGATRLRDDLAATPEPSRVEQAAPPVADAQAVSPEARPAGKPLAAPRKIVSRPPPGSPPAGDGSVPAEAPPPVEAVPIPGPEQVEIGAPPPLEAPTGPADTAASPAPRPRRSPIRDAEQDPPANGG